MVIIYYITLRKVNQLIYSISTSTSGRIGRIGRIGSVGSVGSVDV